MVHPHTKPVKQLRKVRVEIDSAGRKHVVKESAGPVTWLDKIKAYYHTAITLTGTILAILNQVASLAQWIPGYSVQAATAVSAAIGFVTIVANALKSNEQWIDAL